MRRRIALTTKHQVSSVDLCTDTGHCSICGVNTRMVRRKDARSTIGFRFVCAADNTPDGQGKSKFGNKTTTVEGRSFHSQMEAKRYAELRLMERNGDIRELKCQPVFPLYGKGGSKICKYVADFSYFDKNGMRHIEDVKGPITALFSIKKKLFEDNYPEHNLEIVRK